MSSPMKPLLPLAVGLDRVHLAFFAYSGFMFQMNKGFTTSSL